MLRRIFRTSDEEYKRKLDAMHQTADGSEMLDPTPMEPPIGFHKQPSMVEHIRALIRSEKLKEEAQAAGEESFEEADDFDVEDEFEPVSAYEMERYFEPHPPANNPPIEAVEGGEPRPSPKEAAELPPAEEKKRT